MRSLLWLLLLAGLAQAQTPPQVSSITTREVGPGLFEVRVATTVTGLSVPKVPLAWSYLRFEAPLKLKGLLEDSLLGSLYEVDLNGDRHLGEVRVDLKTDGQLKIDYSPVQALAPDASSPQQPYREDGSPKIFTLDPYAPDFMVDYYNPPMMALELQFRDHEPQVQDFPNPCLQIMVSEPCVGPSNPRDLPGEPNFSLSFDSPEPPDQQLMFSWNPQVSNQWQRVVWVAIPLKSGPQETVFRLNCKDDTNPVAVSALINYALEPGKRWRTAPVTRPVWPGAGRPGY